MTKTRRTLTDAFEREAVALLEAGGRPLCCGSPPRRASGNRWAARGAATTTRPLESFFRALTVELVRRGRFAPPATGSGASCSFADIEDHSNRRRLRSALGHLTPEQAERQAA